MLTSNHGDPVLLHSCKRYPGLALFVCLAIAGVTSASALTLGSGDYQVKVDTTLSAGAAFRVEEQAADLIGIANGGTAFSVNTDDGNLNYDQGLVSSVAKATSEVELKMGKIGGFFRINAFYDQENENGTRKHKPLTERAKELVGKRVELLDAYLHWRSDEWSIPVSLRVGSQALNWGESTFIPNGINVINPLDVSVLRTPGAELREALLPVWMVSGSVGLSENLTLEGFYQFRWQETRIEPSGSYFSTNDFAGRGGERVYLGFGSIGDSSPYGFVPRGPDNEPSNGGQFGLGARLFLPSLGNSEIGLYFARYHSRLPFLSARTPTTAINTNLTGPLTSVFAGAGMPVEQASLQAQQLWALISAFNQYGPGALTAGQLGVLTSSQTQAAINGARQLAFLGAAATGRYLVEYPEDLHMIGLSFNADLGNSGIALQGEISYKPDHPLQVDDVELLFAALSSINPAFGPNNQMGNFLGQQDTYIKGYRSQDVWQAQATASKVFGPALGANQWVFLFEGAATMLPDLPEMSTLRFEAPGTGAGGSQSALNAAGFPRVRATPESAYGDSFSFGYQALVRFDYDNLFLGANVSPLIAFTHDVVGVTPTPINNFREGRKTLTLGVNMVYQNAWGLELRYVNYAGGGSYNLLRDRDFVSATLKYSF